MMIDVIQTMSANSHVWELGTLFIANLPVWESILKRKPIWTHELKVINMVKQEFRLLITDFL